MTAISWGNEIRNSRLYSPLEGESWSPIPIFGSLYQVLKTAANKHLTVRPDWVLLHNVLTDEVLRAQDAFDFGNKFALFFERLGFGPGDVVHFIVGNDNWMYPACFGAWIVGGIPSVGDINLEPRQIARQLQDAEVKVLLFLSEFQTLAAESLKLLGDNRTISAFSFGSCSWCPDILEAIRDIKNEPLEPYSAQDPKTEEAIIFWSSGTTGHPKGIIHSHSSIMNFGGAMQLVLDMKCPIQPSQATVTSTCFFHFGGFSSGIQTILHGNTYYHMFGKKFELSHILRAIKLAKPSTIRIGTHHYVQLSEKEPETSNDDFKSVELVAPFGAAVPQSCETQIKRMLPNVKGVINIYGQTELSVVSVGISTQTLGIILPGTVFKIVDRDSGKLQGPDEVGEICVKSGHGMMIKYLNRPNETAHFFDEEGYGRSGDLGYYNDKGELFYVDRIKEIIKFNNNHVSPTELEDILQRHPAVQECLVFGKPDPKVQELITAVVVQRKETKVDEDELLSFVNNQVSDYKRIRGGIIFRNSLPRNSVGKLLRRELRDWASGDGSK